MVTDITKIGIRVMKQTFQQACDDTVRIMKEKAPYPTGAPRGKGSMATGKTKNSIKIEKLGQYHALVAPTTDYAYYAENGRKPITKTYYMKFRGADGKIHRAKHVAGMEGWHFVKETADIIREKYGV